MHHYIRQHATNRKKRKTIPCIDACSNQKKQEEECTIDVCCKRTEGEKKETKIDVTTHSTLANQQADQVNTQGEKKKNNLCVARNRRNRMENPTREALAAKE